MLFAKVQGATPILIWKQNLINTWVLVWQCTWCDDWTSRWVVYRKAWLRIASTEQVPVRKQRKQFQAIPHKFDPALFYGGTPGMMWERIGQDKQAFSVPKICLSFCCTEFIVKDHFCFFLISLEQLKARLASRGCRLGLELCEVPILVQFSYGIQGRRRDDGMTGWFMSIHAIAV